LAVVLAAVIVGWQGDAGKNALGGSGGLLLLVLAFVTEVSVILSRLVSVRPGVDVARDGEEKHDLLKTYFSARPARQADLLEYSAYSVLNLIEELAKRGATLRILIKHPATVGQNQRQKILQPVGRQPVGRQPGQARGHPRGVIRA